ncbi:MAG: TonB-dependent receptor [Pseudomonadota bacterium]|nr:TonB-dependent receptor [Pseudomonadota bacterium]
MVLMSAAGAPGLALAQSDEPFQLDEIVISSTRSNSAQSAIPGAVQVISGESLETARAGGKTLEQMLSALIPGFTPSNGTISGASQTLRGRSAQILIDGVSRTSELRGFSRELALIDPASVERVEVIKGSSARFGNGATGGIINIITKKPADADAASVSVRLSAQEDDLGDSLGYEVSVTSDKRVNDLGLHLELTGKTMGDRFDGNGDLLAGDPLVGQGGSSDYDQYALGFAADYAVGPHEFDLRFDVSRFTQDSDYFTDYLTRPVSVDEDNPYTGADVKDESEALTLTYRNDTLSFGEMELTAYATSTKRRAAFVEPGIANSQYYVDTGSAAVIVYPPGVPGYAQDADAQTELNTDTYGVNLTFRSGLDQLAAGAKLTWGFDFGRDEVEQTLLDGADVIAPMTQDSMAAFAQLEVPVGNRFDLSMGMRAERFELDVDDFIRPAASDLGRSLQAIQLGYPADVAAAYALLPAADVTGGEEDYSATVFNIGGVYHATPAVDLYAGFSQGFSLPDVGAFTRRAGLDGSTSVSFADIKPKAQIVDTYEIGTRYRNGALRVDASAFLSTSDDGTTFDSVTNSVSQQKERVWGGEVTVDYTNAAGLNYGLIASYTEGKYDSDDDGDIDDYLPNNRIVSPFTATLYTGYGFGSGLELGGEVIYASARDVEDYPEVEENLRVNLRGAYPVGRGSMSFGVENLFNRDQYNSTASVVRTNPLTGEAILVADEGRRFWIGYDVSF